MIKQIDMNGKGPARSMSPGPFNVIVGPNGSGKSSFLHAIRYVVTGTSPAGARPGDALAYSAQGQLSVFVLLENGLQWTRSAKRDPHTNQASQDIQIKGKHKPSKRVATNWIEGNVGTFAPMFDQAAFRSLPPEKRRALVMELSQDAEAVTELIEKLETAKGLVSELKEKHDGLVASIRSLTAGQDSAAPGKQRAEIQAKIEKLEGDLGNINTSIGTCNSLAISKRNANEAITATRMGAEKAAQSLKDHLAKASEQLARQTERDEQIELVNGAEIAIDATGLTETKSRVADLDKKIDETRKLIGELQEAVHPFSMESNRITVELQHAESWEDVRKLVDGMPGHDNRSQALAIIEEQLPEGGYAASEKKRNELDSQKARKLDEVTVAKESLESSLREHDSATEDARKEALRIEDLESSNQKIRQEANRASLRVAELKRLIASYDDTKDRFQEQLNSANKAVVNAATARNLLDEGAGESADALEIRKTDTEAQIKTERSSLETRKKLDNEAVQLSGVTTESQEVEKELDAAKESQLELKQQRDVALEKLMAPIVDGISKFIGEPAYVKLLNELGTPIFEIGVVRSGTQISLDALSGGEQAMFCVGLVVSLVNLANPPEKFLLLEGAELDSKNLDRLAQRITEHAPDFQVFVTSIETPTSLGDKWTIHKMDAA